MAGSALYTAVLDANTLYPAPLRDLLLSLAVDGLYHARWTVRIHEEWVRNLARNRPEIGPQLATLVELMNRSVPDCLVENYEGLIGGLVLPDADDRHVLAAAIAGHADSIVTFNLKHFPADALDPHQIEALHPDDFVLNQHEFRFRTRLFGPGVALDAFELRDGCPAGYQFQVIGEPQDDPLELLGRLIGRMRRALALTHLDDTDHGPQVNDRLILRGTVDSDPDEDHRVPRVVIDGREISWDELGRMVAAFEGWQFKLEFRDLSEEV